MRIDVHNHPDWHGHNLEAFIANMDRFQIDKTWILSCESPVDEYDPNTNRCFGLAAQDGPISFARCLSYVERAPDRFILGYAPDPRRPDAIDRLAAAVDIYGVKVYGELKLRMMYDDLDALSMYRFCGEKGLPVLVHLDYPLDRGAKYPRPNYWYGGGIEPFARAVEACPETTFIGHGPGFWAHISNDDQYQTVSYPKGAVERDGRVVTMLRRYPNLYCDLSAGSGCNALTRDRDYAREFLVEWSHRLLYGRDDFNSQLQGVLESLELPTEVLARIYGENAQNLVG